MQVFGIFWTRNPPPRNQGGQRTPCEKCGLASQSGEPLCATTLSNPPPPRRSHPLLAEPDNYELPIEPNYPLVFNTVAAFLDTGRT